MEKEYLGLIITIAVIICFVAVLCLVDNEMFSIYINSNCDVCGDTSEVELLNYDVKTTWYSGNQYYERDGFYHDIPSDASYKRYKVTGTVKNIAGEMLDRVDITAKFYDSNDNYLASEDSWTNNLANSYTYDFYIEYSSSSYFENIDQVEFEFEVS